MNELEQLNPARPFDEAVGHEIVALPAGAMLRHRCGGEGPAVMMLHGIQSHPGWFVGAGDELARRGCDVFQVTRRGSGTSPLRRGHASSAGRLLADLDAAADAVGRLSGRQRIAGVGISWGGKLLALHAARRPDLYASVTLVAPGLAPRVDLPAARKLAVALWGLLWPRKRLDIPLNDPALFTDTPAMRRYLRDDALRLHRATARFLVVSAAIDALLRRRRGALTAPTTLILAGTDAIIDNDRTIRRVADLTGGRARTLTLPGCHTLEFQADPCPYYDLLALAVGVEEEDRP